jgi:hypothetical protein
VIPNSGLSTPPVGGSLNTPPNNMTPGGGNGNYFYPYGTNGFYRRGTNGDFYLRGTNGFYPRRIRDHRDEFYPDENMVYQRGPDGLYHWYGATNGFYPPPAYGAGTNGVFSAPSNNVLPPPRGNPIVIRPQPPQ